MKTQQQIYDQFKLKRDGLVMDIMRLAINITESKDFSVAVNFVSHVGWLEVKLHTLDAKNTIYIVEYLQCFDCPRDDRKLRRPPLDYDHIINKLEEVKQTLNDLLIGNISIELMLKAKV